MATKIKRFVAMLCVISMFTSMLPTAVIADALDGGVDGFMRDIMEDIESTPQTEEEVPLETLEPEMPGEPIEVPKSDPIDITVGGQHKKISLSYLEPVASVRLTVKERGSVTVVASGMQLMADLTNEATGATSRFVERDGPLYITMMAEPGTYLLNYASLDGSQGVFEVCAIETKDLVNLVMEMNGTATATPEPDLGIDELFNMMETLAPEENGKPQPEATDVPVTDLDADELFNNMNGLDGNGKDEEEEEREPIFTEDDAADNVIIEPVVGELPEDTFPLFEDVSEEDPRYAEVLQRVQMAALDEIELDPLDELENNVIIKRSTVKKDGVEMEQVEERTLTMKVFDISLTDGFEKVQPGTPVRVTVQLDPIAGEDFSLYHITPAGAERFNAEYTYNEDGLMTALTFETGSFSPFALTYFTVDFHYNGVDYSMPGQSQLLLSSLIDALNICRANGERINAADVSEVIFSDERLVTVTPVSGLITYNGEADVDVGEKDFLLTSLEPFTSDELLTIVMNDGEVIEVGVTDAQFSINYFDQDGTTPVDGTLAGFNYVITNNQNNVSQVRPITLNGSTATATIDPPPRPGETVTLIQWKGDDVPTAATISSKWWYDGENKLGEKLPLDNGATLGVFTISKEGPTTFRAVKKNAYYVNLQFREHDYDPDNNSGAAFVIPGVTEGAKAISEFSFVRVLLTDKKGTEEDTTDDEVIGYAIKSIPTSSSKNSIAFDSFNLNNGGTISYADAKAAGYYVAPSGSSVRVGHKSQNNTPNYADFDNQTNGLTTGDYDGYTFAGQVRDSEDERTVNNRISDPAKYYVQIDCGNEPLVLPNGIDFYALVKATTSTSTLYAYAKLTSDDTMDGGKTYRVQIPDEDWFQELGYNNYRQGNNQISGHENNVTVSISGVPTGTIVNDPVPLINNKVPLNGLVHTHNVVSYPSINNGDISDPTQRTYYNDPGVESVYTDYVYLSKNDDHMTNYTLETLLTKYNIITVCPKSDAVHTYNGSTWHNGDFVHNQHTVAGILVREDLIINNFINIGGGTEATSPSAVGGAIYYNGTTYTPQLIGGGQSAVRPDNYNFYVGEVNPVLNGNMLLNGQLVDMTTWGDTIPNNDYIDWTALQNSVLRQSSALHSNYTRTVTISHEGNVTIPVSAGEKIRVNYADGISPENTYVTVKLDMMNEPFETLPGTVISFSGGGKHGIPKLETVHGSLPGAVDNGGGISVIYNYPYASEVYTWNNDPEFGHVIAPRADAVITCGNFNGGMIVNSIYSTAEGHLSAYKGGTLVGFYGTMDAGKSIDGQNPTDHQKFEFTLDLLKDEVPLLDWTEAHNAGKTDDEIIWDFIQEVKNENGTIEFTKVPFYTAGDYYFRVRESADPAYTGITNDDTIYIVKAHVNSVQSGDNLVLEMDPNGLKLYKVTDEAHLTTTRYETGNQVYKTQINLAAMQPVSETMSWQNGTGGADGTLTSGVGFINREAKNGLAIRKQVKGTNDTDTNFVFNLYVWQEYVDDETSEVSYEAVVRSVEIESNGTVSNAELTKVQYYDDELDTPVYHEAGHITFNLTANNNFSISGLPSGARYVFKEDTGRMPTGYVLAKVEGEASDIVPDEGVQEAEVVFTNTYIGYYCVAIAKVWDDDNNRDGIRPDEIYVDLYQSTTVNDVTTYYDSEGNAYVKTVNGSTVTYVGENETLQKPPAYRSTMLNDANSWVYLVRGVPTGDINGNIFTYTWEEYLLGEDGETKIYEGDANLWPDYTSTSEVTQVDTLAGYEGTTIITTLTNTHEIEKTSVEAEKKWDDENDKDGLRPDQITFRLMGKYTVDVLDDQGNVTGQRVYEVRNITDADNTKVSDITVDGTADYTTVPDPEPEAYEKSAWVARWTNLPKYYNGHQIEYYVVEVETPDGYTTETTTPCEYHEDTNTWVTELTNKHVVELQKVKATKVWDDMDDANGLRPDITFTLSGTYTYIDDKNTPDTSDDEEVTGTVTIPTTKEDGSAQASTVTIAADATGNDLVASWDNLPTYVNGHEVTYTVTEAVATGETLSLDRYEQTPTGLVYNEKTKQWEITFTNSLKRNMLKLYKSFSFIGDPVDISQMTDEEKKALKFEVTTVIGNKKYYVAYQDASIPGNIHGKWAKLVEYTNESEIVPFTYANFNDGMLVLENLPLGTYTIKEYEDENGVFTGYTWSAATVKVGRNGTATEFAATADTPITVVTPEDDVTLAEGDFTQVFFTNTYKQEKTKVEATKVWDENAVKFGLTQDVTLTLVGEYTDGNGDTCYLTDSFTDNPIKTISKSATGDDLTVKWENLPRYHDGYEITYKVVETSLEGFAITYSSGTGADEKTDGTVVGGEITVTNTAELGALEIDKRVFVDGADKTSEYVDKSFFFMLTTEIDGKEYFVAASYTDTQSTETVEVYTFYELREMPLTTSASYQLKPGKTVKFTGLPVGCTYKVKEYANGPCTQEIDATHAPGDMGDMTYLLDLSRISEDAVVVSGETAEVELVNAYTTGKYCTAVTKQWLVNGEVSVPDSQTLTVKLQRKLSTEDDTKWADVTDQDSITLNKANNWSYVAVGMDQMDENGARYEYRWVETVPTGWVEGKSEVKQYTEKDGVTLIFLTKLVNSKVDVEVPVKKIVTGGPYTGNETFTVNLTDLATTDGSLTGVTTKANGETGTSLTIKQNETGTFTLEGITKPGTYTFKITETAGTTPGMTYAGDQTVTVVVGWNNATDKDYLVITSMTVGSAAATSVTVENHYDLGSLTLTKKFTGDTLPTEAEDTLKKLKFKVTGWKDSTKATQIYPASGSAEEIFLIQFTKDSDGLYSFTLDNLPLGYYEVEEVTTGVVVANYSLTETTITPDGGKVTLTSDSSDSKTATIAFVNEYEHDKGDLEITKTTNGGTASDADKKFIFTVELSDTTISGTYGDATFTNGVARVELKKDETATITGLPTGVTYTVTEASDPDWTATNTVQSGTITTVKATAAFENTRNTGDLIVTKTVVSSQATDKTKEFSVTVTLSDTTISGTYGDVEFADGVATFTIKHSDEVSITGLPTGITYTVEETAADGFTASYTGETGTISKVNVATAAIVNTKDEGSLSVTKKVDSNVEADKTKEFTFTITLKDKDGQPASGTYTGTLTKPGYNGSTLSRTRDIVFGADGTATVDLKHDETMTISGIPAGYTYSVTEAEETSFTTTSTGDVTNVTIVKDETKNGTFTNKHNTAPLSIDKTVVSDVAAEQTAEYTFTLRLLYGTQVLTGTYNVDCYDNKNGTVTETTTITLVEGEAEIKVKGGGKAVIKDLPVGATFHIVEASNSLFASERTDSNGNTILESGTEASFKNVRKIGGLDVHKTVNSDEATDLNKEYKFTVELTNADGTAADLGITDANGKTYGDMTFKTVTEDGATKTIAEFTVTNNQTVSASGLPVGLKYKVTEEGIDGIIRTSTGEIGTISGNGNNQANFTNTRAESGLVVSKAVVSELSRDKDKEFSFTLTLWRVAENEQHGHDLMANETFAGAVIKRGAGITNETAEDLTTDANGQYTFTLKDGQILVIQHLPANAKYKVEEADEADFITTSIGAEGTIRLNGANLAEFVNTRKPSELKIQKVVNSSIPSDLNKTFQFNVKLYDLVDSSAADTESNRSYLTANIAGRHFDGANGADFYVMGGQTLVLEGIPADVYYEVTELLDTGAPYTVEYTNSKGQTSNTTPAEAVATNTRTNANLIVSKTVESPAAEDQNVVFSYAIMFNEAITANFEVNTVGTVAGESIKTVNGKKVLEVKDGRAHVTMTGGSELKVIALPVGIGYTVIETPADGFTADALEISGVIQEGTNNATPATAAFVNTRKTGALALTKEVISETAADKDKEFDFTITFNEKLTGSFTGKIGSENVSLTLSADGLTLSGIKLKHGQTIEIDGLPAGATYSVTETNPDGFSQTWVGQTGTIPVTTSAQAKVTNSHVEGGLIVQKSVVSEVDADKTRDYSFTVVLDGNVSGTYNGMTFTPNEQGTQSTATFTLKDGQSKTATGLPTGIRYTVTEEDVNGMVKTVGTTGDNGTITDTETSVVAFTNTRKLGDLEISKTVVSSIPADQNQDFTFTVELTYTANGTTQKLSGTYGGYTFVDGQATIYLHGGETVTLTGIPEGASWKVVEAVDNNFTTTANNENSNEADSTDTTQISSTATQTAAFENTRKSGELKVSKTVSSPLTEDQDKEFTFKVTLNENFSKTCSTDKTGVSVVFTNGVSETFKLKGGESLTIKDLPYGVRYTVTETAADGFKTTFTSNTGTISDTAAEAAFTNTREKGSLEILKNLFVNDENKSSAYANKEFYVKVKAVIGGVTYWMTTDEGVLTKDGEGVTPHIFTVKPGTKLTINDLPVGEYTVIEVNSNGSAITTKPDADMGEMTYMPEISRTQDNANVPADGTGKTELINEYVKGKFCIAVTKQWLVNGKVSVPEGQALTVTLTRGTATGTNGALVMDESFSKTFTLDKTNNWSTVAVGMEQMDADGHRYTYIWTETAVDGWVEGKQTEVLKNEDGTMIFLTMLTNSQVEVEIPVEKIVTGDYTGDEDFTVTLTEGESNPQKIGVNGMAANATSFTLKRNQVKSFILSKITTPGSYTFTIQETEPSTKTPGMTYDTEAKTVTFTVEANSAGILTVKDLSVSESEPVTITNKYSHTQVPLEVTKELAGREWKEGDSFTFTLTDPDGNTVDTGIATITNRTVTFDPIDFYEATGADGVTYHIQEIVPTGANDNNELNGITYDGTVYTVTIKVKADDDGELSYTVDYDGEESLTVTNTYKAEGSVTFEGDKTLVGRALDDVFKFEMTDGETTWTLENDPTTGAINYPELVYELDLTADPEKNDLGTHVYTVKETSTNGDGITVDTTVHEVTVVVEDNGDGTLNVIASTNFDDLDFVNTYEAKGEVELTAKKVYVLDGDESEVVPAFEFQLTEENGDVIETVYNKTDGTVTFTKLTFTLDDMNKDSDGNPIDTELTYYIVEKPGYHSGIAYDTEPREITITLHDIGDGTIDVTADPNGDEIEFVNEFELVDISLTKTWDDAIDSSKRPTEDEFLAAVHLLANGEDVTDQYEAWREIEFTDDYTWIVTWTGLPKNDYSVLDDDKTIDYTVTEDDLSALYEADTVQGEDGEFTVTNRRKIADLTITKTTVSDLAADQDKEFTFTVTLDTPVTGEFSATKTDADGVESELEPITLDDGTEIEDITLKSGEKWTIKGLPYGIGYEVVEKEANQDNFVTTSTGETGIVDNTTAAFTNTKVLGGLVVSKKVISALLGDHTKKFKVVVTLDDDTINGTYGDVEFEDGVVELELKDGEIVIIRDLPVGVGYEVEEILRSDDEDLYTVRYEGTIDGTITEGVTLKAQVINTRNVTELTIKKTVESDLASDKDEAFLFKLEFDPAITGDYSGVYIEDGVAQLWLKDGQSVTLKGIPLGTAYTVSEASDARFTTTVSGEQSDTLETTDAVEVEYTNTRNVGSLNIEKTTLFNGEEDTEGKLDGEYSFTVESVDLDTTVTRTVTITFVNGVAVSATIDGENADVTDGVVTIDKLPTGTYTVTENLTDEQIDDGIYLLSSENTTIVVTADTSAEIPTAEFTNNKKYTKANPEVTKEIKGREWTDYDCFQFWLEARENYAGVTMPDFTETYVEDINEDHKGVFSAITFTEPGVYFFTIKETDESGDGLTYDAEPKLVVITVTEENGKLTASVAYGPELATSLTVTNTYDAKGEVTFEGTKTLTGRDLKEGEFSFELLDENGDVIETVTNDADGKFSFSKLEYTLADAGKTYKYTVEEVVPDEKLGGVTYTDKTYTIEVAISDKGDGTLKVDVAATDSDGYLVDPDNLVFAFENDYDAEGQLDVQGLKILTGRTKPLEAGEFEFQLYLVDGTDLIPTSENPDPITNDADGTFLFDPLVYDLDDVGETYEYVLKELIPEDVDTNNTKDGITYTTQEYYFKVEVDDNGDGTLKLDVTDESGNTIDILNYVYEFKNTYDAEGKEQFKAKKSTVGFTLNAGDFSFTVTPVDDAPVKKNETESWTEADLTAENDEDGSITFPEFWYGLDDVGQTYYYVISENLPATIPEGYTYDGSVYLAKVTVADKNDGTLEVTRTYFKIADERRLYDVSTALADAQSIETVSFVNKYETENEITIELEKTLTGHALADGQFSFKLTDLDHNTEETVTNIGTAASFTALAYDLTQVGEYHFTVEEVLPEGVTPNADGLIIKDGYIYDQSQYSVTVTVEKDPTDETKLNISAAYKRIRNEIGETVDETVTEITFANEYVAEGQVALKATKEQIGGALEGDDYSFTLEPVGNAPLRTEVIVSDGTIIATVDKVIVSNKADGTIDLGSLHYTQDDLGGEKSKAFEYTLTENVPDPADEYIDYDTEPRTIKVTVTDNGNGTLTVTADGIDDLTFVNTLLGDLTVNKQVLKNGEPDADAEGDFYVALFTMDADGRYIADKTTVQKISVTGGTGTVTYEKLPYGTYYVFEVKGENSVIPVGDTFAEFTVTGGGTVEVNSKDKNEISIQNNRLITEANPEVTKELIGRAWDKDDSFEFKLEAKHNYAGVTMPDETVVTVTKDAEDHKGVFDAITFTEAGAYFFTITETKGSIAGVTYDTEPKLVKIVVEEKTNADGYKYLEATEITYDGTDSLIVTNTYEAEGDVTFEGTKTLTGRGLKAGEFGFVLKDENGNEIETVYNDKNGNFSFKTLTYDLDNLADQPYTYTISEVKPEDADALGGVTYTDKVYTVKVSIADNGDGTLEVTVTDENDQPIDPDKFTFDFENEYEAKGEFVPEINKVLTGRDLNADEFCFTLTGEGVSQTKTNAADGTVIFDKIEYTLDDMDTDATTGLPVTTILTYTIKEDIPDEEDRLGGVDYDPTEITVTVTLTDNGDGTIKVEAVYNPAERTIINTYEAEGNVSFEGVKSLDGRDLTADDKFNFTLYEATENSAGEPVLVEIETVQNSGSDYSEIKFSQIDYTLDDIGLHTYVVKETSTDANGITVSTEQYVVVVKVSDNGDGTLKIETTDNYNQLNFTNTYESLASVTFEGTKKLEGRAVLATDIFSFTITEGEGENAKTWSATSDPATGKINYPTISYTLSDVGDHTYTVKETTVDGNGITVDTTEYTVTVSVTATNGVMKAEITSDNGGKNLDFVNTYKADGKITFEGDKTLVGRDMTNADVFTFEMTDGTTTWPLTNDPATGKINYPELVYELDLTANPAKNDLGKHVYTVYETSTDGNGITVDTTEYEVTVVVTDNGDGTLNVEYSNNFDDLDFVNTYEANGDVDFEGTKTLTGRTLKEGEFGFVLKDENGNEIETVYNAADGSFSFSKLEYTLADAGKTYTYTVKEVIPDEKLAA